jgi:hypothetical protein
VGAIGQPYLTLAEIKSYLSMTDDSRFDQDLTDAIASVSEEIEQTCNRQFNQASSATAREFTADSAGFVTVDDFYDTAGLVVQTGTGYGVTWSVTDYDLHPLNGVVDGMPGWPYWKIKVSATAGSRMFIRGQKVQVTAKWGWAAVPDAVKQACKIMAGATFQIKDAPFGVAGSDQWGTIRVRDNQMAQNKLARYIKDRVLVG